MSRQRKKDEARAAARARRQEQAERTRKQQPIDAGGFKIETTSDNRLLAKAVRQRWLIPDEVFQAVPNAMLEIVKHKGGKKSQRDQIMASKTLALLHGQELAAEKMDKPDQSAISPVIVNVETAVQVNLHQAITEAKDEQLRKFLDATADFGGADPAPVHGITEQTPSQNGVHPALAKPATNGVLGTH